MTDRNRKTGGTGITTTVLVAVDVQDNGTDDAPAGAGSLTPSTLSIPLAAL